MFTSKLWINAADAAGSLFGLEGELVGIQISVDPRHLEELLESLAGLDFPVNPELLHRSGSVTVEFPAYRNHVQEVRNALSSAGFEPGLVEVSGALSACAAAG